MNHLGKSFCLSAVWLALLSLHGSAQENAALPDPSHVVFVAPEQMKWVGGAAHTSGATASGPGRLSPAEACGSAGRSREP